jgi:dipeptidyl aminopeptidase/acylaminoacyl peptidase
MIAIWGWSYGGFVASKCVEADERISMFNKNPVFAVGMAVAPVIDWKYYDTMVPFFKL